jgi:response regulator RpfG family c-di-GMP phosphodiesterase
MADRILIVDDEVATCEVLAQRLSKEGYSCVLAHNGKEALHHFYKENFSLMISDIKMPEMDGLELLKKVKTLGPQMMVIMMTGYAEVDTVVKALHFGAYDFILKPFDLDLVVFSVKKALDKKRLEEVVADYDQHLEELVEDRTADLRRAYGMLKKSHLDSVKMLVEAIDAKDAYTRGHSDRVRKWSVALAEKLGFSEKKLESLEFGALLHDIGMIGIKDEVLQKHGPLNSMEYEHIQEHPLIGVKIVEGGSFFKDEIPMIRHHHERFDGSGYPDGLVGENIPLEARIISIADAFDAMSSLRPYRREMSQEDALVEMEKGKGKQFDPHILEIFIKEKIYRS